MNKTTRILLIFVVIALVIVLLRPLLLSEEEGFVLSKQPTAELNQAKNNNRPIFLEFYQDTWPACVVMKPVVTGLKENYGTDIDFIIVDTATEEGTVLAYQYNIPGVPAFFIIDKHGETHYEKAGFTTEAELAKAIRSITEQE